MKHVWQLQEAKGRFSQVVKEAINHGPQIITKRGVKAVIIISYQEYRNILMSQKKISKFFQESPMVGVELDLKRDGGDLRNELNL